MAQLVAHLLCKQGVTGSSPVSSTLKGVRWRVLGVRCNTVSKENIWYSRGGLLVYRGELSHVCGTLFSRAFSRVRRARGLWIIPRVRDYLA